jgi:hypothetical protein
MGKLWDSVFFLNHFLGLDDIYFQIPCNIIQLEEKKSFLWIEFSQTVFEKVSYYILCELNHIFF